LIRSGQPYNAYKADIWSVGAVVWELIEGAPPFTEVEDPSELKDRWPEFSKEDEGSIALHQFLRLCSEPQQTRPTAKELLNVRNSHFEGWDCIC
jgi:serine/threonine-protein kinase CLA4